MRIKFLVDDVVFVVELYQEPIPKIVFYPYFKPSNIWGDTENRTALIKNSNPFKVLSKVWEVVQKIIGITKHQTYMFSINDNHKKRIRAYMRYIKNIEGYDIQVLDSMIYLFRK